MLASNDVDVIRMFLGENSYETADKAEKSPGTAAPRPGVYKTCN